MKIATYLKRFGCEVYLLVSILCYWILTGTLLNPVAAILLAIVATVMISKNKVLGVIISLLFLLLNLYMVLAMISELNAFTSFNERARQLAIFGSLYFGLNITVSIIMGSKWLRLMPPPEAQHSA